MNFGKARPVEILNQDGTTTLYPSIRKAAIALRRSKATIYDMTALGGARFVDVEIPIDVRNDGGTVTTYPDIDRAMRALGVHIGEVYNMITRGRARLLHTETSTRPTAFRERGARLRRRPVKVFNRDGTTTEFRSIRAAARMLGKRPVQIHIMIGLGRAKLIEGGEEEGREGDEEGWLDSENIRKEKRKNGLTR